MAVDFTFSRKAFWDVDVSSMQTATHSDFIIEKVFDRGTWEEMKQCVQMYGYEKVKEVLTHARYLRPEVVRMAAVLFEIPENTFRCYKLREQMLQHSDY